VNTLYVVLAFVVVIIIFLWWQLRSKQGKVHCVFIRANKTIREMDLPEAYVGQFVRLNKGKENEAVYYVHPHAITMKRLEQGIWKFIPYQMPMLIFKWNSIYPLDPQTWEPMIHSPEAVNKAFQSESYKTYASANASAMGHKKSKFPEWFFPVIMVGCLLIVLFLVWQLSGKVDGLSQMIKLGT